ncbi:type II secretion system protein [Poriferisphaera sp. WC338]|uniref:type II secretion system protein n=1 Tax=Poriferisphaera sp. WC338 TaxID=3425129 RepID=UPI003D813C5D
MMSARQTMKKGFTLVEILIVVVILGILAAIVIPQFTSASETAKSSSAVSTLQTIRSQLELYQVQHNGEYPTLTQMWGNMTAKTNTDGTTTGTPKLGPYLQKAPANPFFSGATSTGVAADSSSGWQYNAATGEVKLVLPTSITTSEATDLGLDTTNDVVVTAS